MTKFSSVDTKKEIMPTDPPPKANPSDYFAAERTLLAWIRTGLAMMGFGFVVARFGLFLRELASTGLHHEVKQVGLSLWFGTGLVALGVAVTIGSAVMHQRIIGRMLRGEPLVFRRVSPSVIVAWLLALLGGAMAIYLAIGLRD